MGIARIVYSLLSLSRDVLAFVGLLLLLLFVFNQSVLRAIWGLGFLGLKLDVEQWLLLE